MNSASVSSAIERISGLDWRDANELTAVLPDVLEGIAREPERIRDLVASGSQRIEQFPNLYKVVLAESDGGPSLRLHVFPSAAPGSRHSHRWVFASRVLTGRLRHLLFEEDVTYEQRPVGAEPLVSARVELPGNSYVLWPSHVHSIEALEPALTLVIRGPESRQERFVHIPNGDRGWSRRYSASSGLPAGAPVEPGVRAKLIEQVLGQLEGGPLRA
ncbi:hypothetical protein ACFQV6_01430 [Actinoplanes sp. GCM10030250]